jgi:hypothetical protein
MLTFEEYLMLREGLPLADRPPAKGLSKINPFPTTNAHRRRLRGFGAQPAKPFPPTVRAVPEVVPQKSIPRLNLTVPP